MVGVQIPWYKNLKQATVTAMTKYIQGQIQDFKYFKELCRAEGGANIFGVFCVKNHDVTPKNHIFSNFRGGAHWVRPPPGSAPDIVYYNRIVWQATCSNYFPINIELYNDY